MRSQIACAYYNKISRSDNSDSAGIEADRYASRTIGEIDEEWAKVVEEIGLNIKQERPKQLTKAMFDQFDKIIVMAEKEFWPDYMFGSEKVEYWEIKDPKGENIKGLRKTRDDVISGVKELLE